MDLHNNHNVYILGAGFSVDRGMPLMSNFMLRMRDAYDWLVDNGRNSEAQAIANVLEFRKVSASAAYRVKIDLENIEELFSLASASGDEQEGMAKSVRIAIAATLDFCSSTNGESKHFFQCSEEIPAFKRYLHKMESQLPPIIEYREFPIYQYLLYSMLGKQGVMEGENTFISFNYDTIVEEALNAMGFRFTYGFDPKYISDRSSTLNLDERGIKLLKLHGSINWARERGTDADPDGKVAVYDSYAKVAKNSAAPDLVPPTWRKNFDGGLETIWGHALKAIETATRIIVVGFSVPETDTHFKYLMAAGLQNNISIRDIVFVNPDTNGSLESRIRTLFADTNSSRIRQAKVDTRSFFMSHLFATDPNSALACARGIVVR